MDASTRLAQQPRFHQTSEVCSSWLMSRTVSLLAHGRHVLCRTRSRRGVLPAPPSFWVSGPGSWHRAPARNGDAVMGPSPGAFWSKIGRGCSVGTPMAMGCPWRGHLSRVRSERDFSGTPMAALEAHGIACNRPTADRQHLAAIRRQTRPLIYVVDKMRFSVERQSDRCGQSFRECPGRDTQELLLVRALAMAAA